MTIDDYRYLGFVVHIVSILVQSMLLAAWASGRQQVRRREAARQILRIWRAAAAALAILSGRRARRLTRYRALVVVSRWLVTDTTYQQIRQALRSVRLRLCRRAFRALRWGEFFWDWRAQHV